jgi:hypothetical protein
MWLVRLYFMFMWNLHNFSRLGLRCDQKWDVCSEKTKVWRPWTILRAGWEKVEVERGKLKEYLLPNFKTKLPTHQNPTWNPGDQMKCLQHTSTFYAISPEQIRDESLFNWKLQTVKAHVYRFTRCVTRLRASERTRQRIWAFFSALHLHNKGDDGLECLFL